MDLLKQSGESLAGRIAYLELGPFDALEIDPASLETLWVRGDFRAAFWPSLTISVCFGGAILFAPTWSATYRNSVHAYRRRR